MRTARIKIAASDAAAMYHCVTRTVNGEWLFHDVDKSTIREFVYLIADACGVEVITYTIMSNHLHIIVLIPKSSEISDAELLRRFQLRRAKPTKYDAANLEVMRSHLVANNGEGKAWRKRQLALMSDVSQYMKILKQKITWWYNRTHDRFGTLWAERFTSVLIDPHTNLAQIIAVYVDLNCVRANLCSDPKDYRFCGYSDAVIGNEVAQRGIKSVTQHSNWEEAQSAYRLKLFDHATSGRREGKILPAAEFERVIREGGHLPLATILRCRMRYFTGTLVLGSKTYVAAQLTDYRRRCALRRPRNPYPLPNITEWGPVTALRAMRGVFFA